jgi:hypothetical protein
MTGCRSFVYFVGRDAEAGIGCGSNGVDRYLQQSFLEVDGLQFGGQPGLYVELELLPPAK